jgi:hypothetical protein
MTAFCVSGRKFLRPLPTFPYHRQMVVYQPKHSHRLPHNVSVRQADSDSLSSWADDEEESCDDDDSVCLTAPNTPLATSFVANRGAVADGGSPTKDFIEDEQRTASDDEENYFACRIIPLFLCMEEDRFNSDRCSIEFDIDSIPDLVHDSGATSSDDDSNGEGVASQLRHIYIPPPRDLSFEMYLEAIVETWVPEPEGRHEGEIFRDEVDRDAALVLHLLDVREG